MLPESTWGNDVRISWHVGILVLLVAADAYSQRAGQGSSPNRRSSGESRDQSATPLEAVQGLVKGPGGQPVSGAVVTAHRSDARGTAQQTRTDSAGAFRLNVGRTGLFVVTVETPSLAPKTIDRVRAGMRLNVSLTKGGVIEGFVRDVEGRPVPQAHVTAHHGRRLPVEADASTARLEARTDRSGRYRLEGLDADLFTITASAPGFLRADKPNIRIGSTVDLVLLPGGTTLAGVVVGAGGRPIGGATVRVELEPRFFPRGSVAITDATGRFELPGLSAGTYQVIADAAGFAPTIQSGVGIEDGVKTAETELVLLPGATLTGRVIDGEGRPLRATVDLQEANGHRVVADFSDRLHSVGDVQGHFEVQPLAPGSYTFAIAVANYGKRRLDVEVPRDQRRVNVGNIPVERGLAISGRVTNRTSMAEYLLKPELTMMARSFSQALE